MSAKPRRVRFHTKNVSNLRLIKNILFYALYHANFFQLTPLDVMNALHTHLGALRPTENILEPSEVENFTRTSEISDRVLSTLNWSSRNMYVTYVLSKTFLSMHSTMLPFSQAYFSSM